MGRGWRAACGGRRRALLLALLAGAALLLLPRAPAVAQLQADFPHTSPAALADFLADFSNVARLHPDLETWTIESESRNYTTWEYTVSYACGARCRGRAVLSVHREHEGAPQHSPPAPLAHRLRAADTRCEHLPLLPLLPWPTSCEETESETVIEARAGGGARLRERAHAQCGAAGALLARWPAALAAARRRRLLALRRLLAAHAL